MTIIKQLADIQSELDEGTKNIPRGEINLQTVLNYAYAILGMLAVVTIIYNAVVYLTSQGEPGTTKKATQGIIFSVVGLGIVLLAALITNFIFTTIGAAQE